MPLDQVFISYSHEDTKWREELEKHLKPYVRAGSIKGWSDIQIVSGSTWFEEIKSALVQTNVAVLLVTPAFLASDFIHEHELGPLLKEAEQGGVKILWIPVRTSSYMETALQNYQAVIDPGKPLAGMSTPNRDRAWALLDRAQAPANLVTDDLQKRIDQAVEDFRAKRYQTSHREVSEFRENLRSQAKLETPRFAKPQSGEGLYLVLGHP